MKLSAEQFDFIAEIANGEGTTLRNYPANNLPSKRCLCVSGNIHQFLFTLARRLEREDDFLADQMYDGMCTDNICGEEVVYFPRIEAEPEEDEEEEIEENVHIKVLPIHIAEEWDEGEDGYWIQLKKGWKWEGDPIGAVHLIHEPTRKLAHLEQIMPCDCEDCKKV